MRVPGRRPDDLMLGQPLVDERADRARVPDRAHSADRVAGGADELGFFVGAVMRETGGKANAKVVNELLREKLRA